MKGEQFIVDDTGKKEEDVLIDEPLPRLPLKVRPIELILKNGGKGKPAFTIETEISIH